MNLPLMFLELQSNLHQLKSTVDGLLKRLLFQVQTFKNPSQLAEFKDSDNAYFNNSLWKLTNKPANFTPNGGTTLPSIVDAKYWQRVFSGSVKLHWWDLATDGVTGNADKLLSALTLNLPIEANDKGGLICIEKTVNFPDGARLFGNATFTTVAGNYPGFVADGALTIYGIGVDLPVGYTADFIQKPGSTNLADSFLVVRNVSGKSLGTGKLVYQGVRRIGTVIDACTFEGGTGLCLLWSPQRARVSGNKYRGSGRAIQFYGGSYNEIVNNVIDGQGTAITGITIFSWRINNGVENLMRGNVISNNVIHSVTEEGISLDCIGNNPDRWPEHPDFPLVTVVSANSPNTLQVQVILSEVAGAANALFYNYYAVVLTGNAAGSICRINSSLNNYIMLDKWTGINHTDLAAGDKILITTGMIQNVISGNTVKDVGTHCISLYGSAWGNRVIGNTCMDSTWRGISIVSVLSGGGNAKAYSGMNVIENNTVATRDNPDDQFDTVAAAHANICIESRVYNGGDAPVSPRTVGNIIRGNRLLTAQPIQIIDAFDTVIENNTAPNNSIGIKLDRVTRITLKNNRTLNKGLMTVTDINATPSTGIVIDESLAQVSFTADLTYNAIASQGYQTQFVTIPYLSTGDVAMANPESLPVGMSYAVLVVNSSGLKVAVRMFNYSAASITPGTIKFNGVVFRKLPTA